MSPSGVRVYRLMRCNAAIGTPCTLSSRICDARRTWVVVRDGQPIMPNQRDQKRVEVRASVRSWNWIRHNPAFGITPQVMRSKGTQPELGSILLHGVPDHSLSDTSPQHFPARQTHRNSLPARRSAARIHRSTVVLTHSGIGTVRMCPPLPTRSTMAQCSSRCCR